MAKSYSNAYRSSFTDDDSGISCDYDYSSSSELNSSRMTLIEPCLQIQPQTIPLPIPGVVGRKRTNTVPLIKFPSDGISERIRPATMKNSKNSDFIICHTNRGAYIAYRTSIVPEWVTKLVHEIELQQR
ncbi:unnamed protein product [Rotaria sp. Silwood2]|nr:unnamed protein product [Rotaria sp. Silwood2]CAF2677336.1 unnamed protein product [Rotaria sp. Silwood2]CAF2956208.1 unnamed protein product [Rotaria sp. Silwood2]CAF3102237.1 unnamed protein product [Rotaria sp. Silwood2]CAF3926995.1 unnamed protein product [Rotaria sp. Silwood2]